MPPSAGQVRIRVAFVGLCGTDLHVAHGDMDQRVRTPLVFGHEMSGTVDAVGDETVELGAGEQARDVARWARATLDHPGELLLLRARTQFALGRHAAARKVLAPLLSGQERCALPWTLSEGMVTGVRIAIRDGMADRARRLLDRMLSAAEATGVWYSLVFATPEVIETLTASLGRLGSHDSIATQVLMRRRGLASPAIPPPLTERELSVLRLLPTMRSVDEIAEDLTVSPNTVKTHVRGIYSKLNVRSRRDAVLAAVARGLLHGDAVATPE